MLNDTAFLVSEISVSNNYHTACLTCAQVYEGCDGILLITPQNVTVRSDVIPTDKLPVPTIHKTPICVVSNFGTIQYLLGPFLLPRERERKRGRERGTICAQHKVTQKLSLHCNYLHRKSSCCVPITLLAPKFLSSYSLV